MIKENETKEKEIKDTLKIPKIDDIVEGKVIGSGKASLFVDLGILGAGVIYGREFYEAREKIKTLDTGSVVFSKIIGFDEENDYIELSLNEARKELSWDSLKVQKEKDESSIVRIIGANKGGLLTELFGVQAFIPVSQLSSENYPKVEGGDNQKILKALQKFVGREMEVKIFDLDQKEEKLILSEKMQKEEGVSVLLEDYKVGDTVKGEITGIVDFGAFVKFGEDNLEGLIHISEMDWRLIKNPNDIVKIGDKLDLKIVGIENNKVSLSIKALKEDPWKKIEEDYKVDQEIKGKVVKLNAFGSFIEISPDFQGLCHISEFGNFKSMEESLEVGKEYNFKVISIEPKEHRISLRLI